MLLLRVWFSWWWSVEICVVVSYVNVLCCFFFFKQKTAYEMRISDWSSDVCSSDLHTGQRLCRRRFQQRDADGGGGRRRVDGHAGPWHDEVPADDHHQQIGRASCRERVCQYV